MSWNIDASWTLFLDRDGVINERIPDGYVRSTDEFVLLEGADRAIARASEVFGRIVVVTNQQGIGKGIMTERNLSEVHDYMNAMIAKSNGRIDGYYFAPQLAAENSPMRKPGTGMGLAAQKDFPEIDFQKSIIIGDSKSDMEFGRNLGMKTVFVTGKSEAPGNVDLVVDSLEEAVNRLL